MFTIGEAGNGMLVLPFGLEPNCSPKHSSNRQVSLWSCDRHDRRQHDIVVLPEDSESITTPCNYALKRNGTHNGLLGDFQFSSHGCYVEMVLISARAVVVEVDSWGEAKEVFMPEVKRTTAYVRRISITEGWRDEQSFRQSLLL